MIIVLDGVLKIVHPLMPFISENIWCEIQNLIGNDSVTLMREKYPRYDEKLVFDASEKKVIWLKSITSTLRNMRGEMRILPHKVLKLFLYRGNDVDRECFANTDLFLKSLAKIETIEWIDDKNKITNKAVLIVDELELLIPLSSVVDLELEKTRLTKELAKTEKEYEMLEQKLQNNNFVNKAPANIVIELKGRKLNLDNALKKLKQQLLDLN